MKISIKRYKKNEGVCIKRLWGPTKSSWAQYQFEGSKSSRRVSIFFSLTHFLKQSFTKALKATESVEPWQKAYWELRTCISSSSALKIHLHVKLVHLPLSSSSQSLLIQVSSQKSPMCRNDRKWHKDAQQEGSYSRLFYHVLYVETQG